MLEVSGVKIFIYFEISANSTKPVTPLSIWQSRYVFLQLIEFVYTNSFYYKRDVS